LKAENPVKPVHMLLLGEFELDARVAHCRAQVAKWCVAFR